MGTYKIALIVGSIRRDSLNKKLAQAMVRLAPEELAFTTVRIDDLPLYSEDVEADPDIAVLRFRGEIKSAQGFVFVTPEYNRSIPGVLKNAIDVGSRPRTESGWTLKPAGVLGLSTGTAGTAAAQQHLRNILAALNVFVLAQPAAFIQAREGLFDEEGNISPGSEPFFRGWMDAYLAWVKRFAG